MSYWKCILIYIVFALISGIFDAILKVSFKDNDFALIFRVLIGFSIGGYLMYYLINIYL